jgi:hypothetical protein
MQIGDIIARHSQAKSPLAGIPSAQGASWSHNSGPSVSHEKSLVSTAMNNQIGLLFSSVAIRSTSDMTRRGLNPIGLRPLRAGKRM